MLLPQQVQAILYHFLMGWVYGCTFSFLCSLTVYLRFSLIKGILEILFHGVFTLLAFYGLYQINGAVTNLYLILFFLLGVVIYYRWYLPVFIGFFKWWIHLFAPIRKKLTLAKKKIVGIIKVRRQKRKAKREKRRAEHGKQKEKTVSADEEVH